LGWFHSTPKTEKPSKERQPNRAEKITANGGTPLMPPVDADYLIGYWQDMGLVSNTGMGAASLSALEIDAFCRLSAVELDPWEFKALREMSANYASHLHLGENPNQPPPYGSLTQEYDRQVVGKKVTNAFKAFLMAGRK
jgi:hypothetical protein